MPSEGFLSRLADLEANVADCQKDIDRVRALYPYDNVMQYALDQKQTALDVEKKEIRRLKEEISNESQ